MRFQLVLKICLFIFGLVGSLIVLNSLFYHHHHQDAAVMNVQRRSIDAIKTDLELDIIKLFERTNQVLEFFESNFEQLNADGLFGVRIAQGLSILITPILNIF